VVIFVGLTNRHLDFGRSFERADESARRFAKLRSELYRDALSKYLRRHDPLA
jgi:hypothetical protein